MMKLQDFTIGCDPELFLKADGRSVSATETSIIGTKEKPQAISGGAVQIDGLALEINTDPVPANDFSGFNYRLINVLNGAKKIVGARFSFDISPTVTFDPEYWKTVPDSAKELGCNPDWNAYTGKYNPKPDGDATTMRTGAGHIHIGWGKDIPEEHPDHLAICCDFVKMLDLFVGLGTLMFDKDTQRRSLYGRAGAFRPKSYGVEYRVPSNAWLANESRRGYMHTLVGTAINNKLGGYSLDKFNNGSESKPQRITEEWLQRVINESDVKAATTFLRSMGRQYGGN